MFSKTNLLLASLLVMASLSLVGIGQGSGPLPPTRADTTPPTIIPSTTPVLLYTGDLFYINATVTDTGGGFVQRVELEYWYGSDSPSTKEMDRYQGADYSVNLTAPMYSLSTFNYLIRAFDNASNMRETAVNDIDIFDNDRPVLNEDLTPNVATTGEDLTFTIDATDNIGMLYAKVKYRFGGSDTTVKMDGPVGHIYTHTINVPGNMKKPLTFSFLLKDNTTIEVQTPERTIPVIDNDLPVFMLDQTPAEATTGDRLRFSVMVSDNVEVLVVSVVYTLGGEEERHDLVVGLGNEWYREFELGNVDGEMEYYFIAHDNASNENETPMKTIQIIDNDPPLLQSDLSDKMAYTGDPINFKVNVTDNIMVEAVWVVIEQMGQSVPNATLENIGGRTWQGSAITPDSTEQVQYRVHARDATGNLVTGPPKKIDVEDNDDPVFGSDLSTGISETGAMYSFRVEVSDNVLVDRVHLVYFYGIDGALKNLTMLRMGDRFELNITLDKGSVGVLNYYFKARDSSNNWEGTPTVNFTVVDTIEPSLPTITLQFGATGGTGQKQRVSMTISDNIDVARAAVFYKVGDDPEEGEVEMYDSGREWVGLIPIPLDRTDPIWFYIKAWDDAGNENTSVFFNFTVKDVTPPRLDQLMPVSILVGESFEVELNLSDNIDAELLIVWTVRPELPFGLEGRSIGGRMDSTGTWKIDVVVRDSAGNRNETGFTLSVREPEKPPVEEDEKSPLLLFIVLGILLAIVVVFVVVMMVTKSKKRKVEERLAIEEERIRQEEEALKAAEEKLKEEEDKKKAFERLYGMPGPVAPPSSEPPAPPEVRTEAGPAPPTSESAPAGQGPPDTSQAETPTELETPEAPGPGS